MTAKEMFEELGYQEDTQKEEGWVLSFLQNTKYSSNRIIFYEDKTIEMGECAKTSVNAELNMKLLKAINQQCKDLGWLND